MTSVADAFAEMLVSLPQEVRDKRAQALLDEVGRLLSAPVIEPEAERMNRWRAQVARAHTIALSNLTKARLRFRS